jgi:hypothetical protein
MDVASIVDSIQSSGVGEWMRTSVKAMPIVNALHVLAATTLFGTVLVVDLRLLGFPDTRRPITRISLEMLRLTWAAFFLALVTGALMFAANGNTYLVNTAFQLKLAALLGAGINMAIFQGITYRSVRAWDAGVSTPRAARIAGALSILIWVSVIFLARWVGFTKGYNFEVPENIDFTFE